MMISPRGKTVVFGRSSILSALQALKGDPTCTDETIELAHAADVVEGEAVTPPPANE
jgi:hypothetical protein